MVVGSLRLCHQEEQEGRAAVRRGLMTRASSPWDRGATQARIIIKSVTRGARSLEGAERGVSGLLLLISCQGEIREPNE